MTSSARLLSTIALIGSLSIPLQAFDVRVTIENLAPTSPTGLYFGPTWLGFHNGGFDLFNGGSAASPAMETLAELGDSSLIRAAFASSQPSGVDTVLNSPGGPGPGLFAPGATSSLTISLDPLSQRYLSWASMIVPSNDSFTANGNPLFAQLFDPLGNFAGAQSWTITGSQIWDSGTEVNDPMNGGVFVAGVDGMLGASEGGVVHFQPLNGLDNVIGITTPAGTIIGQGLSSDALIRISIAPVPEPSTYGLIASGVLLGLVGFRARRNKALAARK